MGLGAEGREQSKAALEQGDLVAATAGNTSAIEELAAGFPGRALAVNLDVRDEEAARMAVSKTTGKFRGIDVVFNNAGYALVGSVEQLVPPHQID